MTEATQDSSAQEGADPARALSPQDLEALDDILDEMRARLDETPQWEFCDGFLTALVCSRRAIAPTEYLPMLLGDGEPIQWPADAPLRRLPMFADMAQQERFLALWQRRFDEVALALDTPVEALDDPRTLEPEVMDVRGALLALPEAERPAMQDGEVPSFAQVWALGFMFAVENWPEDWAPPRDREQAQWLDDALDSIVALTEDDTGKPAVNMYAEDGPPSVSETRVEQFGEAIWAVYDLRQLWKSLGPRVETLRKAQEPGRNDPCWCGSGKKFKKCHGA
jgi:uncharacterized protein